MTKKKHMEEQRVELPSPTSWSASSPRGPRRVTKSRRFSADVGDGRRWDQRLPTSSPYAWSRSCAKR